MNDYEAIKSNIDALYSQLKDELPLPCSGFGKYEDFMVPMEDGARLATRVFYPEGDGPWPVILVRNPYTPVNKKEYMMQGFLLFLLYGYAVVFQQVRGVFDSEGEWYAFEQERDDGIEAVLWVESQSFCDGNIGSYGSSYLGHVQWCMADAAPSSLKTMYISVYGASPYELCYENGMFKLSTWAMWASQMMDVRGKEDLSRHDMGAYKKALNACPPADMDLELYGRRCQWLQSWLQNPERDSPYWTQGFWGKAGKAANNTKIPIMLQGGWYDIFLPAAVEAFKRLPKSSLEKSRFLIGPWHHGNQPGGDIAYPDENRYGSFQIKDALLWFNTQLKGCEYPYATGGIEAYSVNEGIWRHFGGRELAWAGRRRFYLDINEEKGAAMALQNDMAEKAGRKSYDYNPEEPVPTIGGNLLFEEGAEGGVPRCATPQPQPGWRADVLSFLSEPLEKALLISGRVKIRLCASTDAEDSCFTAKLMEVDENGVARNIRDGAISLSHWKKISEESHMPGQPFAIELDLWDILWEIKAGSQIRLDISSSNYPAFHRHPNKSGIWSLQKGFEIARQTLFTGAGCDSWLEIPFL